MNAGVNHDRRVYILLLWCDEIHGVYFRRFGVDSDPVTPMWFPHRSDASSAQHLEFSLNLMSRE